MRHAARELKAGEQEAKDKRQTGRDGGGEGGESGEGGVGVRQASA